MCVSFLDNLYTIICKWRLKRKNCSRGKQVRSVDEVARCTTGISLIFVYLLHGTVSFHISFTFNEVLPSSSSSYRWPPIERFHPINSV